MATLKRYEPWPAMSRLQNEINRVFGSYAGGDSDSATAEWSPAVDVREYAALLFRSAGTDITAYTKVYPHVLRDADALADWQSGTALLPYRERLGPHEYAGFEAAVRSRLRARWPGSPVFFPFRRTLLAATHPGAESATPRPVLASGRTAGST